MVVLISSITVCLSLPQKEDFYHLRLVCFNHYTLFCFSSGDIAFRFLDFIRNQPQPEVPPQSNVDNVKKTHVTVCDINQAMLDVGKQKAVALGYNVTGYTSIISLLLIILVCTTRPKGHLTQNLHLTANKFHNISKKR